MSKMMHHASDPYKYQDRKMKHPPTCIVARGLWPDLENMKSFAFNFFQRAGYFILIFLKETKNFFFKLGMRWIINYIFVIPVPPKKVSHTKPSTKISKSYPHIIEPFFLFVFLIEKVEKIWISRVSTCWKILIIE